jgi:hypothetical protein
MTAARGLKCSRETSRSTADYQKIRVVMERFPVFGNKRPVDLSDTCKGSN